MALDPRVLAAQTVLAPPTGARVQRDLVYRTDGDRVLKLDLYRPASSRGASPVVFLVNGDAPEEIIATAKDWGVFRSYGEHLASRGIVGVPFNHRSSNRLAPTEVAAPRTTSRLRFHSYEAVRRISRSMRCAWASGSSRGAQLARLPAAARSTRGAARVLPALGAHRGGVQG
ncbi:MAG: hypothetical protein DMD49_11035 [Gemmatimonadetes bacterium]|nr:MAG: hypothetical protein DMD49_11035 [Gemmatimonadota bacterium]